MIMELLRLETSTDGTLGALKIDKKVFCATMEPPDKENKSSISSIPAGQYICERVMSPKYGNTFEITGVTDRTHVLFHSGNVADHTKGCVLLGKTWGKLGEDRAILNSGDTFTKFLKVLHDKNEFHLTISEVY